MDLAFIKLIVLLSTCLAWGGLTVREPRIPVAPESAADCDRALTRSASRGLDRALPPPSPPSFSPFGHSVIYDENAGRIEPTEAPDARQATRGGSTSRSIEGDGERGLRSYRGEAETFDPELLGKAREEGLVLSEARDADAGQLKAFVRKSRGEFADSALELDDDLDDITGNYNENAGHIFVVRRGRNGPIVGSGAVYHLGGGHAEIRKLYLDPSLRDKKLGKPMFQHLLNWAKERHRILELETYANMARARGLYESFGMTQYFPRRIQKENATIADPSQHVIGYILFLHPRSPIGPQTDAQKAYQLQYERGFAETFAKELKENPANESKFAEHVFLPILQQALAAPRAEYSVYGMLGLFLKKIGIRFPEHYELVERILGLYSDLDLDPRYWLLPGITLKRDLGNGRAEYRTITPGMHFFPREAGFEIIDRVPDEVFRQLTINGFLPLSNLHDMHHFLVLISRPEFMRSVAKAEMEYRKMDELPDPLRMRRLSYALESLALGDPTKTESIYSFLAVPRASAHGPARSPIPFNEFNTYFSGLPGKDLVARAAEMSAGYRQRLVFYSGAGISPIECAIEDREVREKYKTPEALRAYVSSFDMPQEYDKSLSLPRESFAEDPTFWSTRLAILLEYRNALASQQQGPDQAALLAQTDGAMRTLAARMEYFLWNSAVETTQDQWIRDLVYPDSPFRSKTLDFIRDSFGKNSITYRMLTEQPAKKGK